MSDSIFYSLSQSDLLFASKVEHLRDENTTAIHPIFRCKGALEFIGLWGVVVTTNITSNHTNAHFRFNDQISPVNVTLSTGGGDLSNFETGSLVFKGGAATVALKTMRADAGRVAEPVSAGLPIFSPFFLVESPTSGDCDLEYVYTTTDSPSDGYIEFFCIYRRLSANAEIVTSW